MKPKGIVYLLVLTSLFSCKNEEKSSEKKIEAKQCFSATFDVVCETKDDFTVYYTETGTNEFKGELAVWGGVKGGNIDEKIVIDLPEEIIPTNIRVDFGIKPDRKDVLLKKLKFDFYGNSFEIKGSDFFNYFVEREDDKTEVDPAAGTVKFIKTPSQTEGSYYYPRQELLDKIKQITKEKAK
jgi:hypothetical protein